MIDIADVSARLNRTAARIEAWRAQAAQLQALVEAAQITRSVSDSLLQSVEETAGAIYAEIDAHEALKAELAAENPAAAAELAEVGEALHLVLMEITELSTQMYAVHAP
jgi:hypothetical protein